MTTLDDLSAVLNENLDGWNRTMGLRFVRATGDEVVAELAIGPQHHQPYGIVHGGVYCSVIETVASVGAGIHALSEGRSVVGLENSTSFLRAARDGKLTITARPLTRGHRTQVWEGVVADVDGKTCATGRVRILCLEPGAAIAGHTAEVKPTKLA